MSGEMSSKKKSASSPSGSWVNRVEAIRSSPKTRYLFYAGLAGVVLIDVLAPKEHLLFSWQGIPGFTAVYGFLSCLVLILGSKFLGHAWLMKPEDKRD